MTSESSRPRIAIWCAVSSEPQANEDKISLPEQREQGEAWAARQGGEVVRIYEVVHTRSDFLFEEAKAEVPQYQQLQDDLEQGAFSLLWCRGWDRVARSAAVAASIGRLLRRADAQVYSAKTGALVDADSLAGRMLAAIEQVMAEEEIAELTRRFHGGIRARVRRGLPSSNWPHGYDPIFAGGRVVGGEFNEDIGAVRYATELFLNGVSYESMVLEMGKTPYRTPNDAESWSWRTLYNWMNNDHYAGIVTFGESSGNDVVRSERSDKFPALWNEETHRSILRERDRRHKGGSPAASMLSGLVRCARCGGPMICTRYREYAYFRCRNHGHKHQRPELKCHANNIRESELFEAIEARFAEMRTMTPAELRAALFSDSGERATLEQKRAEIERRLGEVELRRERLSDAVADGAISHETARVGEDKVAADKDALLWEQDRIDKRLALLPNEGEKDARVEAILALPASVRVLDEATGRRLLRAVGVRVWVENRRVVRVEMGK